MIINVILIQRRLFIDVTSCFYESTEVKRNPIQSVFVFIYFSLKVKGKTTNTNININASMMLAELLLLIQNHETRILKID
jgi:hypothetical protein